MKMIVSDAACPHLGGNLRHGDLNCLSFAMWKMLVDRFAIRSMLDVGCGEGHAVKYFHSLGCIAHGVDGLMTNVQRAVMPIALHDLTNGPYIMPVDMTLSIEVAEHIEEAYVGHYLETLRNGKIIVMTHALPSQQGFHHVNCQPEEYWTARLEARGYVLDPMNNYWRNLSKADGHQSYFAQSGLVFLRRD